MTAPAQLRLRHMALRTPDIADRLRLFGALGFAPGLSKSDADGTRSVEPIRTDTTPDPSAWPRGLTVDPLASAIDMPTKDRLHPPGSARRGVSGVDRAVFKDLSGNPTEIAAAIP